MEERVKGIRRAHEHDLIITSYFIPINSSNLELNSIQPLQRYTDGLRLSISQTNGAKTPTVISMGELNYTEEKKKKNIKTPISFPVQIR